MAAENPTRNDQRSFGPLVEECNSRGIGRTVAFKLASEGTIKTFRIGRRRFVVLSSLDSLPERMAARGGAE